jgi:hypothetical protein
MRQAVRQIGEALRGEVEYRGFFTVDGVLTADGFRPTELNTRMSAGATAVSEVDRRFFTLLQANLVAGVDTGLTAADVEGLVPLMDETRTGKTVAVGEGTKVGGADSYPVAWDGTSFEKSSQDTGSTLAVADTPTGFFATVDPCVALTPGERLARVNMALLAFMDREYGARFGTLEAAPDLR